MALLIDTSLWVDYLRGAKTPANDRIKETLTSQVAVFIAPVIYQEILQGAKSLEQLERWHQYFSGLRTCLSSNPLLTSQLAAKIYLRCRQAGITPCASNDCLIAAIAIEHHLLLVHRDRDFVQMATVITELRQELWL